MKSLKLLAISLAIAYLLFVVPVLAKKSSIIYIGTDSLAQNINEKGQVVGFSGLSSGWYHAFFWSKSDGMIQLQELPGAIRSFAIGINNKGQVVGGIVDGGYYGHAFLWTKSSGMKDLGPGCAYAINDNGQIVGSSDLLAGHPAMWATTGDIIDLGSFGSNGVATSINNLGHVVGYATMTSGSLFSQAFLWTESGGIIGLGSLPGAVMSFARGINDNDQVVGSCFYSNGDSRAFLWTPSGGMVDLGTLPNGDYSDAYSINNRGEVVGVSTGPDSGAHAFIWTISNGMVALGSMGGSISSAYGINNNGQVVGFTESSSGTYQAFLLNR